MLGEQIMRRSPKCLSENDTVQSAAKLMRDENIGFVPICDDGGKLVGTVTDRDIVVRVAANNGSLTTRLGRVMSHRPIVCKAGDDLSRIETSMEDNQKARVICVDDVGRPIGVISLSDIAQHEEGGRTGALLRRITQREANSR